MGGSRGSRIVLLLPIASLLLAVVPLGGCFSRSRPVAVRTSTAQLQTASEKDLIERSRHCYVADPFGNRLELIEDEPRRKP